MSHTTDPHTLTETQDPVRIRRSSRGALLATGMILNMGLVLTMINVIWHGMTACCCTNYLTTASSIPAFLISTGLIIHGRYNPRWERLIGFFFWIIQGFFLINNITDILWSGHLPWLR